MRKKAFIKNRRLKLTEAELLRQAAEIDPELFSTAGREPLTDELIAELVAGGWREADLRDFAQKGAMYSRSRHSLFLPPEVDLS